MTGDLRCEPVGNPDRLRLGAVRALRRHGGWAVDFSEGTNTLRRRLTAATLFVVAVGALTGCAGEREAGTNEFVGTWTALEGFPATISIGDDYTVEVKDWPANLYCESSAGRVSALSDNDLISASGSWNPDTSNVKEYLSLSLTSAPCKGSPFTPDVGGKGDNAIICVYLPGADGPDYQTPDQSLAFVRQGSHITNFDCGS